MDLDTIMKHVHAIITKIIALGALGRVMSTMKKHFNDYVEAHGLTQDRWGWGNTKTGTLGTYRGTHLNCPRTCAQWDGCYALGGKVAMQMRESDGDTCSALLSAAAVLTIGAVTDTPVRLHVSGDFMLPESDDSVWDRSIDVDYLMGLLEICQRLEDEGFQGPFGWTYTHIEPAKMRPYVDMLRGYITIMWSDQQAAGGAMVHTHERSEVAKLRAAHPDLTVVRCPNQTTDGRVKCATCKVCFDAPEERQRLVIFDPHGARASRAVNVAG